jgi:SAM-dependent methyltransferase
MPGTGEPHYFTEKALQDWTRIGAQHRIRDEQFLRTIGPYFRPGSVLEIGAATGHLSEILKNRGWDVTASDISPRFVGAIQARGVRAQIVDATSDIKTQTGRTFANVVAQSVVPLIRRDRETVKSTLAAIHAALEPDGRLLCVCPFLWREVDSRSYFSPREQIDIASQSGLFRTLKVIPHQVVPTAWYRSWNARFLNYLDFRAARIAANRLVWILEKIE